MSPILPIAVGALAVLSLTGSSPAAADDVSTEADDKRAALEQRYEAALDCVVVLSTLENVGASVNSPTDAWVERVVDLSDQLGRPGMLDWKFRHIEVSAFLEVDPDKTTRWIFSTADGCADQLPLEKAPVPRAPVQRLSQSPN